jgi:hypothetical protein
MKFFDKFSVGEVGRFRVFDGWRRMSIIFVLAAHLLPLGAKARQGM